MLFQDHPAPALAISQPAHTWVYGQILRAWDPPLCLALPLASEQHDIGAAAHAPLWGRGVEWGLGEAARFVRDGRRRVDLRKPLGR